MLEWICLRPEVVCGFWTSCRKDFTTQGQVILRVCLLKLGSAKQERAWDRSSNRREPRRSCHWLTEKSEKRGLGDRFRGFAACCSPGCKSHGGSQNLKQKKPVPRRRVQRAPRMARPSFVLRTFLCLGRRLFIFLSEFFNILMY